MMSTYVSSDFRALLVTQDCTIASAFKDAFGACDIGTERRAEFHAFPAELASTKYEALVIDLDTIAATAPILAEMRRSPSNKRAPILAVATGARRKDAFDQGATFVVGRPLVIEEINQVIRRAYDLILQERRRYFRCTFDLDVIIRNDSGEETHGRTLNVSSAGLAFRTDSAFDLGQPINLAFHLPGAGSRVLAIGTVVWDDRHGKTGVNFCCNSSEMQSQLDRWLDDKFCQLFPKVRQSISGR